MQEIPAARENEPGSSPSSATTISSDFAIPSDLESTQEQVGEATKGPAVAAEAQAPLVVIEYRYRGAPAWLLLTLLMVVATLGIVSYRRLTPPPALRRIQQSLATRAHASRDSNPAVTTTKAAAPVTDASPGPLPLPAEPRSDPGKATAPREPPVAVSSAPVLVATADEGTPREGSVVPGPAGAPEHQPRQPERHPIGVDAPAAAREFPPKEQGEPPAAPATRTVAKSAAGEPPIVPAAPPPVSNAEIERDINREAEQRRAEQDMMRQAKGDARRIEQQEAVRQAYDQRVMFRRELREIVRKGGPTAGRRIDELCDQYGRNLPEVQRTSVGRRMRSLPDRFTRKDRVEFFRRHDIPEPVILDELVKDLTRTHKNARGGVRSDDEVFVLAARELLNFPVPGAKSGAPRNAR